MKKVWLVIAALALGGSAANTFADVQNIRLSGDIRMRGYFLAAAAESDGGSSDEFHADAAFISQRTRICVEADLEDHVLVVVTLKAEGLWGTEDETGSTAGAGQEDDASGPINRRWDLGVTEAYVQLNEVFYSAATLKLGRQYLHYGRGLLISSVEQEYNYDAARLVLDYYPFTLDIVGARLTDQGSFGGDDFHPNSNLLWINGRYEMSDSLLKDIEFYYGWVSQSPHGGAASGTRPPTSASPMVVGIRGDANLTEGLSSWFEAAYEFGTDSTAGDETLSAWLINAGLKFGKKDWTWSPVFNANYTYASGGGKNGRSNFVPWLDYVDGYNGYLFSPHLSNIQIFNAGVTLKPWENTSLSVQGYYYLKVDRESYAGSNVNIDFGGLEFANGELPTNSSRELGWEIDTILGYDYSKDVRMQLVYAAFLPGNAYNDDSQVFAVAHEVRGEVSVKF